MKTILKNGTIEYRNAEGQLHREDGPAIEWENGYKAWYLNGLRHREDGPSIEWANGYKKWHLYGIEYSGLEFNKNEYE